LVAPVQAAPVLHVPPPPAPAQQIWPIAPQASQVPPTPLLAPMQRPPAWQIAPGQHAPSIAPQFMQTFGPAPGGFAHPRPALHVLFAQHC